MRIYENGHYRNATEDEIFSVQQAQAAYEAAERHRPLTTDEVARMLIEKQINTLDVDDATALRMLTFYPEWAAGVSYTDGYKVQHSSKLYKALQEHTSQAGWEPENAPALWTEICETHDGSEFDPIPYSGNMALEQGKYYAQDGVTYLCTRDTVNPVYQPLNELVGVYVEEATT